MIFVWDHGCCLVVHTQKGPHHGIQSETALAKNGLHFAKRTGADGLGSFKMERL
jgi:hypothetical protein